VPADPFSIPELAEQRFRRSLLIKPSSLGDVIHGLPVLRGLRGKFPQARIDWLISSSLASLLQGHRDVTDLVLFDRKRLGRLATSPRAAGAFVTFVRGLREKQYDLVIDLQGLFRSGFFAWASGAPVRLGFTQVREGASLFYTHTGPEIDPDTHAADRNWRLAQCVGLDDAPLRFDLQLADKDRDAATQLLTRHGWDTSQRMIAVLPGARWETKLWAPQRFAQVTDGLHRSGVGRCVLLGGESERDRCRDIVEACENPPLDLCGLTPLRTLAAMIERADVTLCHDSGPMHIAVALNRPLVCLIGPTNPRRTGPYHRPESVVRLDLDCAPCYLRKMSQCQFEHRCMRDLTAELVEKAVREAVSAPGATIR
jgi:lipopolysaccharide heptosyltransferase I